MSKITGLQFSFGADTTPPSGLFSECFYAESLWAR
jgi:hypothetical protein